MASVYNRKDFLSFSKDHLLDYIEQQNEQLARFETRFRDVVKAYKGVLTEKEALESSLHALNGLSRSASSTPSRCVTTKPIDTSLSDGEQELSDGQQESEKVEVDAYTVEYGQITTLTQALSTLAQEKSKMEHSYQQDKKNLLTQQELLTRQHSTFREEAIQQTTMLQHELQEIKDRLAEEKRDRREEEEKFGDMLKELQDMVNKERNTNESLYQELTLCRQQLTNNRTQELSETIDSLNEELFRCKQELKETGIKLNEPSLALTRLQEELRNIKQEHAKELEIERHRVNETELRCQLQSQQEEQRVSDIETRLSEMSQIIGEHEGYKERDQLTIQKLRDRVVQLDSENTALTKAQIEMVNRVSSETVSQITSLQDRVTKLRQLLRVATQKIFKQSSLPNNLDDMTVAEYSDMLATERSHEEELVQLRTEYNTYKQRAQSVLKNKNTKEQDSSKELHEREERYEEIQRMVETLQKEKDEEREQHSIELQKLRQEIRESCDTHSHEMVQSEVKHKQKLQDLQSHIQTTRERAKNLLEEKDTEISQLRGELQAQKERSSITSNNSAHSLENSLYSMSDIVTGSQNSLKLQETGTAIQELLDQPSPTTGDVKWFLHAQEQQRFNGEITTLRRKRLGLEDNIRDLIERDQRNLEQTTALKMEIRKLERDRTRETENFEYLKNIILHYMCAADSSSRIHLIRPIATVLHFTPNEVSTVEKQLTRGWFSPSK